MNKYNKLLSVAVATAMGLSVNVSAQDDVVEEVVVTGIRASLQNSMNRKREAFGVVDAITAEDMGKFPDTNLAESLQRISGVSIDRSNNEGSTITVRGMGSEFNLVTLNGRTMPTAGSRSFDFGDIASEGVSAVEVYKTSKASLPTGGIGATVNMQTVRPLDNPGFKAVVSGKGVYEASASSGRDLDSLTPEISGIYSDTFMNDTIGVSISGSIQERNNREENAGVDQWFLNRDYSATANITDNNQRADGATWYPQNLGYGWSDIERKRTNGQLVLQYKPVESVTTTLDYTYSEVDFEKDTNGFGIWFNAGGATTAGTINERGTFTSVSETGGDYATNVSRDHTIKENNSLGFNVEWQARDNLSFDLDMHSSTSEVNGGGLGSLPGSTAFVIIGNTFCDWCGFVPGAGPSTANIDIKTATYGAGGVPLFDISYITQGPGGGLPQAELLPSDIGSLFGAAFDTDVDNEILQLQLGGNWENQGNGALKSINFGVAHTEQEFARRDAGSPQLPAGFWLTSAVHWDDAGWETESTDGLLSGFSNGGNFAVPNYYTADFDYIVDGYETLGSDDCCIAGLYYPGWGEDYQDVANNRGFFNPGPFSNSSVVDEIMNSFYTQFNFEDEFNGMPLNAVVGLRYEVTNTKSYGTNQADPAVVWVGGNEFIYDFPEGSVGSEGLGKNKFFLPSLDLDLEVRENLITRFSYGRSISRPPVGALSPNRSFAGNPKVGTRNASFGNPNLKPYVSDNFDLSAEFYYGEGSYVSAGHFRKIVDNFLISTTTEETIGDIRGPYFGPRADEARAQLADEGTAATDPNVFARINENMGAASTDLIYAQADDPLVLFDVTRSVNGQEANLFGWELAAQHLFGDTGFGVLANMTIVNGDVEPDRDSLTQGFVLPGISDSANLSVFYENDDWSARLAYNWRDEFFSGLGNDDVPNYVEEYSQIDFNVSYNVNDQLSVFLEGLNVTEETQRVYARYKEQLLRANEYGARYNIGARYKF